MSRINEPNTLEDIAFRVQAIERALAKTSVVMPSDPIAPSTVDITIFLAKWERSRLLQQLYPVKDNGSRSYFLNDFELEPESAGYWPAENQWHGLYLGGNECAANENRRAFLIPLCLASDLHFFTPQNGSNLTQRLNALELCSSAVVDFSHDALCDKYTAGIETVLLFARGFVHVHLLKFPENIATAILNFDESDVIVNACGPWDSVSLRQRRNEYYIFIKTLISAMDKWTLYPNLSGVDGFEHQLINFRSKFSRPKTDGVQIPVTSRLNIYRALCSFPFATDIGSALRILLGIFILCEMRTREFMTENCPEWRAIRGAFSDLQNRAALASKQLQDTDYASYGDCHFHLQAFVDLVNIGSAVVSSYRHLD